MMGDQIKFTLGIMATGLKDSIKGIGKVITLDRDLKNEASSTETVPSGEPMSTLARRRAEKHGTREVKQPSEPKVMHRILLCCAWNGGLFLLSIILFYGVVLPTLQFLTNLIFGGSSVQSDIWWWLSPILSWTFNALWILPLFVLSKIVNSLWFQDIADAAYRKSRGRPQLLPSLSKIIADVLFSLLLQALFLIQGMLASLLPIGGLGHIVYLLHISLLYSLYAFEYKWFNMGWEVQKRLSYIETNWPYFVGFGLPLALFTAISSSHIIK
ncbi:hypothetical protein LSH36_293g03013 [Paralvinella palmiformis]|uniref:Etoposide-induced protein 2.4 n=1 Tax=Paralvinella palmiformis TaxID=53620 RepID=A0AAD9JI08_9ANNE|nr:hypothetical protein LSH36_293g03013 [Paralvinella palmiformis]